VSSQAVRPLSRSSISNLVEYRQYLAGHLSRGSNRDPTDEPVHAVILAWLFKASVRHFIATGVHLRADGVSPGKREIDMDAGLDAEITAMCRKRQLSGAVARRPVPGRFAPDDPASDDDWWTGSSYMDALDAVQRERISLMSSFRKVMDAPEMGPGWCWRTAPPTFEVAAYEWQPFYGATFGSNDARDGFVPGSIFLCNPAGCDVLALNVKTNADRPFALLHSYDGLHPGLLSAEAAARAWFVPRMLYSGDPGMPVPDGIHDEGNWTFAVAAGVLSRRDSDKGSFEIYRDGRLHCDDGPAAVFINQAGDRTEWWFRNGVLHRDDGPAVVGNAFHEWWSSGRRHREDGPAVVRWYSKENRVPVWQEWHYAGLLHRRDGPALVKKNGPYKWYRHGLLHRADGPAVIDGNMVEYWLHGKLHRLDGPAVLRKVEESWYLDGRLHRADGPAKIARGNLSQWYRRGSLTRSIGGDGRSVSLPAHYEMLDLKNNSRLGLLPRSSLCVEPDMLAKRESLARLPAMTDMARKGAPMMWLAGGQLHREDGPALVWPDGTQEWFRYGKRHRLGGPAVVSNERIDLWCQDGVLHREDGPAAVCGNELIWMVRGKRHREDGPAVVGVDTEEWFRDGKRHREAGPAYIPMGIAQEHFRDGMLHREDGPARVWRDGSQEWYRNGLLHRDGDLPAVCREGDCSTWWANGKISRAGGPAIVRADGTRMWLSDGVFHRDGGPAVTRRDGTLEWYREGKLFNPDGPVIVYPDGTTVDGLVEIAPGPMPALTDSDLEGVPQNQLRPGRYALTRLWPPEVFPIDPLNHQHRIGREAGGQ
jgi:hypothetical protein